MQILRTLLVTLKRLTDKKQNIYFLKIKYAY